MARGRIARRDLIGWLLAAFSLLVLGRSRVQGRRIPPGRSEARPQLARGVFWGKVSGEWMIATRQGARLLLNETAAEVLALCDGSRTGLEISAEVSRRHRVPVSEVEGPVQEALKTLRGTGVLSA